MKTQSKKGLFLSEAFGAVMVLILVAILVIISLFLFTNLGTTFGANTAAANATNAMITQFAGYPALVGLVGTIIFLALVIGVLISSFAFGGQKGV